MPDVLLSRCTADKRREVKGYGVCRSPRSYRFAVFWPSARAKVRISRVSFERFFVFFFLCWSAFESVFFFFFFSFLTERIGNSLVLRSICRTAIGGSKIWGWKSQNACIICRGGEIASAVHRFEPPMGNAVARAFGSILVSCGRKEVRILMLGLDGAGKTTILYKLKLGDYVRTVPTIGFNIETVEFMNLRFTVWDVGGQDKIRHLWRQYIVNAQGLVFVVDSCDKERLKTAKQELERLISDPELSNVKLLVMANKHDLPTAMAASDVTERLALHNLKGRKWHIQICSGKTGEGLRDGLKWLASAIKEPSILQRMGSIRLPRSFSSHSSTKPSTSTTDGKCFYCSWPKKSSCWSKRTKRHT